MGRVPKAAKREGKYIDDIILEKEFWVFIITNDARAVQLDAQELRDAKKKFDKDYGSRKVGWILKRLSLKYLHTAKENRYNSFLNFTTVLSVNT